MFNSSRNTLITGGTFNQFNVPRSPLQILQDATAPAAFHNSGERCDPPKCHPNTRVAVLKKIMRWIMGEDSATRRAPIMWVHGPAGSGKSAIEQTIAEMLFTDGQLLASFFFSRFDSTRNHPRSLIPTLAYQIATHFPEARQAIQATLDVDPLLLSRSLSAQIDALIVHPLQDLTLSGHFKKTRSRRVIIIDGLDECEDRDGQTNILCAISQALDRHRLPLLLLIASRSEHDITLAFVSQPLSQMTVRLPLDDKYKPSNDIRLFLLDKFDDIKQTHPLRSTLPSEWPSQEILRTLIDKSSGQFIYAATVVRFVQSTRHRPTERLEVVLSLRPASRELPFGELDALYHQIFESVEDKVLVLNILSCYLLAPGRGKVLGRSISDIKAILSLQPGDVKLALSDLHSIVKDHTSENELHVFHASLEDFLLDERRSRALYIDAPSQHARIALMIMDKDLVFKKNTLLDFESLGWHIKHAEPSPLLVQAIYGLDIIRAYSSGTRKRLAWSIAAFLKDIKDSKLQNREEIYDMHFRRFKTYATEQLRYYYTKPDLTSLIAVVLVFCVTKQDTGLSPLHNFGPFLEPKGPDGSGLQILGNPYRSTMVFISLDYAHLLRQICSDQDHPSVYFDDSKYATAALFFAKHLSLSPLGRFSMIPAQTRLINLPWKWRKTVIWRYKGRQWDCLSPTIYGFKSQAEWARLSKMPGQNRRHDWIFLQTSTHHIYNFLECFSSCLEHARLTEELSAFVAQMAFNILAFKYPEMLKQAQKAVRQYLKRQKILSEY